MLLYGSKTWVLLTTSLASLEGFHIRAAHRMAVRHKPRRGPGHRWIYPKSKDVLEECGMNTLEEYTVIVCRRIVMYSSRMLIPYSSNTSFDFGYIHLFPRPLRGLCLTAIWYAARMWNPSRLAKAAVKRTHVLLP